MRHDAKGRAGKPGAQERSAKVAVREPSNCPRRGLRQEGERLLVPLRVIPRAASESIALEGGALRVRVTAPPVAGAANAAVIALLARHLGVPKRAVSIVRGTADRDKLVAVEGYTAAELLARGDL